MNFVKQQDSFSNNIVYCPMNQTRPNQPLKEFFNFHEGSHKRVLLKELVVEKALTTLV
jgi:hypothetical protein